MCVVYVYQFIHSTFTDVYDKIKDILNDALKHERYSDCCSDNFLRSFTFVTRL